jgi:pentatricopeptide repeat protein
MALILLNTDLNETNVFDRRITLLSSKRSRSSSSNMIRESTQLMRNRAMRLDVIAILFVMVCLHIYSSSIATTYVAAWVLDSTRLTLSSSKGHILSMRYSSSYKLSKKQTKASSNLATYFIRDKTSRRSATVDSTRNMVDSFSTSEDDEEEDGFRQQDIVEDDENYKDFNNAAIEHSEQQEREKLKASGNTAQMSMSNRNKSRNGSSNKNTAFHDPQFLRKRTADLLKVTEDLVVIGSPQITGSIDTTNGIPTSSTPHLGRHMKVEKKTFHFLLDAWAFSGESDAAEQAMTLLRRMEELGQRSSATAMNPIQPDVRSYTKAINAIARHASENGGDDAEILLEKMRSMFAAATHTNPEYAASIKPNSYTYTAVIQAHANSGAIGSPERAEALVERMIDKYQRGDDSVRPTAKTFNAIIHAYGKARNAERAAAVFNRMERLYESGVTEAKPNAINYNALITAWANCDLPDSAQRAEAILEKMEGMYKKGDKALKPTTVSFNAVIDAYAKSGEGNAAQKSEELLRHMYVLYEAGNVEAKPNTRSFNSVINAWAKSGDPNAASNAAELLELMEEKYEQGDTEVRPDVHSFCTTINGTFTCAPICLVRPI